MSKELIDGFATHLQKSGKSTSTVTAYTKDLEQIAQHADQDLHQVHAEGLKAAIEKIQKKHNFTPKTVSRKINSLRTFYKYLQEQNHIDHNPAADIPHPKIHASTPRVLTPMEYFALREVSRDNVRLHHTIELMLQTGLRIGEVSRLKLKHVNLDPNSKHLHVEPFSTIPERRIPLTDRAHKMLKAYLEQLKHEHHEHPLFPTRHGKHIIIRNIRSSIDRAMQKAGIEDACVNDLRNTFIVHQLKHGIPIDFVAKVVGHKSQTTTQKYLELLEEEYRPTGSSNLVQL